MGLSEPSTMTLVSYMFPYIAMNRVIFILVVHSEAYNRVAKGKVWDSRSFSSLSGLLLTLF